MEDTHAFLYNFLNTPALAADASGKSSQKGEDIDGPGQDMVETDNGYFAIFDGHAGTFAADWCGKKLHLILEDVIRKNPNLPIPELLDQTFTAVDSQLEKLPLKNSGCTAAIAVLRWEDRVPSNQSATGSQALALAASKAAAKEEAKAGGETGNSTDGTAAANSAEAIHARLKGTATRNRVLYTANVGDARIILCRNGKALRLSYDHKGSDENEGKRIANAGGLILNNRVNGVLAVTRALGDAYMKDLVTGHPYTTETVIQPEIDEFIIIACDGVGFTIKEDPYQY
jgi:protein phosphatase PTC1